MYSQDKQATLIYFSKSREIIFLIIDTIYLLTLSPQTSELLMVDISKFREAIPLLDYRGGVSLSPRSRELPNSAHLW